VSPPDLPFYHVVRIYGPRVLCGQEVLLPRARFTVRRAKRTLWMLALRLLSDVAVFGQHFAAGAVAFFGYGVNPCGGDPAVVEIEEGADGDDVEDGFVAIRRPASVRRPTPNSLANLELLCARTAARPSRSPGEATIPCRVARRLHAEVTMVSDQK
jgi:hypothetical protein